VDGVVAAAVVTRRRTSSCTAGRRTPRGRGSRGRGRRAPSTTRTRFPLAPLTPVTVEPFRCVAVTFVAIRACPAANRPGAVAVSDRSPSRSVRSTVTDSERWQSPSGGAMGVTVGLYGPVDVSRQHGPMSLVRSTKTTCRVTVTDSMSSGIDPARRALLDGDGVGCCRRGGRRRRRGRGRGRFGRRCRRRGTGGGTASEQDADGDEEVEGNASHTPAQSLSMQVLSVRLPTAPADRRRTRRGRRRSSASRTSPSRAPRR